MNELSKKDHEIRFREAICDVIKELTDHKSVDIKNYKIDADNIITVEFKDGDQEDTAFIDFSWVEFIIKKKSKELEKQKKDNNANKD